MRYRELPAIYRHYEDDRFMTISVKDDDGWWRTLTITQEMFNQLNQRRREVLEGGRDVNFM